MARGFRARHRIRVNAISPGPVETEGAGSKLRAAPEVIAAMLKTIPRDGIGEPQEIAHAAYLVSDFADFIIGEVLVTDGGPWLGKGCSAKDQLAVDRISNSH
jgi:NAD(P)-dependent dehydrogenase (short-subunit alcohol dehydrogenase family)